MVVWKLATPDNFFVLLGIFLLVGLLAFSWLISRRVVDCPVLILLGVAIFGIYSLCYLHPYLHTLDWVQDNRFYFTGRISRTGDFHLETVDNKPLEGKVYLSDNVLADRVDTGVQRVRLTATIEWPETDPSFASYLRKRRYLGVLRVHALHDVQPAGGGVKAWPVSLRSYLSAYYRKVAIRWPLSAAFSRALVLGEKQALPGRVLTLLRNFGISHLFVISGLHVGFFYFWLSWIIPDFRPGFRFLILLGGLICYLSLIGWPISAVRAVLMVSLYSFSQLFSRKINRVSLLSGAVFLLLLFDPFVVLRTGFQLTVAAMLGIFAMLPYARWLSGKKFLQLFLLNLGAFFGVAPVVLYHFHYLPTLGVVFSYLAGLLFPFFLGLLAVQNLFLWTFWTFFADHIETLFQRGIAGLEWLFLEWQFTLPVSGISVFTVLLLATALWLVVEPRWPNILRAGGFTAVIVVVFGLILPAARPYLEQSSVAGLPVTYLRTSAGGTVLILPRRVDLDPYGVNQLDYYLRDKGIRGLTTVISDFRRQTFERFGLDFPVQNYVVYWREETDYNQAGISFNFQGPTLHSPFEIIRYNNPPGLQEEGYCPKVLTAHTSSNEVLVTDTDRIGSAFKNHLKTGNWDIRQFSKTPYLKSRRGELTSPGEVQTSVEENLLRMLTTLLNFLDHTTPAEPA